MSEKIPFPPAEEAKIVAHIRELMLETVPAPIPDRVLVELEALADQLEATLQRLEATLQRLEPRP